MADKNVTWVLPATALVTLGVLAYALYNPPPQAASSGSSGVQFPGYSGLAPTAPSSPNATYNPASFQAQGYGAPLSMPTGTLPNLEIPAINVPAMVVNNISGAACGGCGNF